MKRMNIRSGIFILALVAIDIYLFAIGEAGFGVILGGFLLFSLLIFLLVRALSKSK
jgi:hypothetical protein